MPTFCRHNRLVRTARSALASRRSSFVLSCPRCAPDEPTPSEQPEPEPEPRPCDRPLLARRARWVEGAASGRGADDGYSMPLLPGLRSSEEAERLAQELRRGRPAGAARRRPSGPVRGGRRPRGHRGAQLAGVPDRVHLPVDDEGDPFTFIRLVRTPWGLHEVPDLDGVRWPAHRPRPRPRVRTIEAYRAWAGRSGSQADAFTGDAGWTPERRFARTFERLALPGLHRGARFDLLVTLGRLGVYELRAGALQVGGDNEVTVAAKRALGIGDPMLLERRAADLAQASRCRSRAWTSASTTGTRRAHLFGVPPDTEPDPAALASIRAALGL